MEWEELFKYNEESPSCLTRCTDWLSGMNYQIKKASKGDPVGTKRKDYWATIVCGKKYMVHRIIWELHYGEIPKEMFIDHIDGDNFNNTIENLRIVCRFGNARNIKKNKNNTSGVTGVSLHADVRRSPSPDAWIASWKNLNNKLQTKSFSINKYGYDEAFRLACEWRQKMILELNVQGAGYTERHGL